MWNQKDQGISKLDLIVTIKNAKNRVDKLLTNRTKMILICVAIASLLLGIAGAIIYNSMYMQSNIGVKVS
jgi:hypothetical protein